MLSKAKEVLVDRPVEAVKVRGVGAQGGNGVQRRLGMEKKCCATGCSKEIFETFSEMTEYEQ